MSSLYFGGIEGGATHSKLIICNQLGEIISIVTGPGTNHWIIGIPECARRIAEIVNHGKSEANIPLTHKLQSLGLSLSGAEQEATNKILENELRTNHQHISENYVVCSDTIGSVFAASNKGGLVIISGTGSNTLLSNPDGSTHGCGGWGNVLGDEGSAWWISHKALKIVFDDMDNFIKSPYPIDVVWNLIKEYFSVQTRLDLLDHCYAKFEKPFFAGLCIKLSEAARSTSDKQGDQLCKYLFGEAGKLMAQSILALLPKVDAELTKSGYLNIVCVGSVWKSWDLLKVEFLRVLSNTNLTFGLKLLRLTQSMAIGAVYLGADSINFNIPRNYEKNYEVFHYYNTKTSTLISSSVETMNNNFINGNSINSI